MNFINLRISGIGLNLEEITQKLKTDPNTSFKKGDTSIGRHKEIIMHTEDYWIYGEKFDEDVSIDEMTKQFVVKYLPCKNYIKELAEQFNITLWVSLYLEDIQFNVHLSAENLKSITELGVTLDITFMYLRDFYEGNY